MKTKFFVYKIKDSYLRITERKNQKEGESMFKTSLVKDINKATYWEHKGKAKTWMVEKKFPTAKLITCGLCEMK